MEKQYDINGVTVNCPTGFSLTALLFGPFVPLQRGDVKWFFINIIVHVTLVWTFGIGNLVWMVLFAAIYNGIYEQGIKRKSETLIEQRTDTINLADYIHVEYGGDDDVFDDDDYDYDDDGVFDDDDVFDDADDADDAVEKPKNVKRGEIVDYSYIHVDNVEETNIVIKRGEIIDTDTGEIIDKKTFVEDWPGDGLLVHARSNIARPYVVIFKQVENELLVICECKAYINNLWCKHRQAMFDGRTKGYLDYKQGDRERVIHWLEGTTLEKALEAVQDAESHSDKVERRKDLAAIANLRSWRKSRRRSAASQNKKTKKESKKKKEEVAEYLRTFTTEEAKWLVAELGETPSARPRATLKRLILQGDITEQDIEELIESRPNESTTNNHLEKPQ